MFLCFGRCPEFFTSLKFILDHHCASEFNEQAFQMVSCTSPRVIDFPPLAQGRAVSKLKYEKNHN